MTLKHTPTDEQGQIITDVADPAGGSIMVEAYAGTAKSTTLEMAAPGIRAPALATAFNRDSANMLQKTMPQNFTCKTFNGLGYGAWMRANPQVGRWEMDDRKLGKIISQIAKERKTSLSSDGWDQVRKLTSSAMQSGITPGDIGSPMNTDSGENWLELADACWIHREDTELFIDIARETLLIDIDQAKKGKLSFNDQVYCSAVLGGKFPRYPVVFADEVQDLNPLNHRMLALSVAEKGRLVMVGDRRQAIYGFRGADHNSMDNAKALMPQWKNRRLTLTFRCPKAIVARQQEHAPGYRAAERNAEGAFSRWKPPEDDITQWNGWQFSDIEKALPEGGQTIAILCRNNAPIMGMAFKLIRAGVGCQVLGRDIGKGLQALLKKINPEDHTPADIVMIKITEWMERERGLAEANDKPEKVAGIMDKGESLVACLEGSGARTAGELREVISQLFEKVSGRVVLSTIHRAKGLEWDLVLHLDPWRIPSKFAKKAALTGDGRQLTQEWNLKYVCETRTKHTLINANLEDYNG